MRKITILNFKGGTGKTTTAVNLIGFVLNSNNEVSVLFASLVKTIFFLSVFFYILAVQSWAVPIIVKEKTVYHYAIVERFGQYEPQLEELSILEYNENGDLVVSVKYDRKEQLLYKTTRLYNEQGYMVEEAHYGFGGKLRGKTVFEYDERGNNIVGASYDSEGNLEGKRFSKFDKNGKGVSVSYYDSEGKLSSMDSHIYDENGNETEWIGYGPEGKLQSKTIYRYDERGNRIAEVTITASREFFSSSFNLLSLSFSKYNQKGKVIEIVDYDSSGRLNSRWVYKYNEDEKGSESFHYYRGRLQRKTTYKYNEEGYLSEETEYNYDYGFTSSEHPVEKQVYEYEYYQGVQTE